MAELIAQLDTIRFLAADATESVEAWRAALPNETGPVVKNGLESPRIRNPSHHPGRSNGPGEGDGLPTGKERLQ